MSVSGAEQIISIAEDVVSYVKSAFFRTWSMLQEPLSDQMTELMLWSSLLLWIVPIHEYWKSCTEFLLKILLTGSFTRQPSHLSALVNINSLRVDLLLSFLVLTLKWPSLYSCSQRLCRHFGQEHRRLSSFIEVHLTSSNDLSTPVDTDRSDIPRCCMIRLWLEWNWRGCPTCWLGHLV